VQDSGAFMLIVFVRDVDATFARVKALGAPIVTKGGSPIGLPAAKPRFRVVVVKDPDGHFVEIVQADQPPETQAPPTANVIAVRVRLTVADVDKALALYRDALGMKVRSVDEFKKDPDVNNMLGLKDAQYRVAMLEVPTTGLVFELIDFKGVDRKTVRGNIQDPARRAFSCRFATWMPRSMRSSVTVVRSPRREAPRSTCRAAEAQRQRLRSCATRTTVPGAAAGGATGSALSVVVSGFSRTCN
jgi:catechol 2,3-dioxygenase-like lactoylglutathione lyase family enzyme